MKTLQFGWEADSINGNSVQMVVPIEKPIIIRGIELDCAYMPTKAPAFGFAGFAEILFSAAVFAQPGGATEFGPPLFDGATVHGGTGAGHIVCGILKTYVANGIASATARNVVVMGLNISATYGQNLQFNMGHAGYPGDAEMQGVLFYEDGPYG